jgi:hypothetical protein
VGSWFMQMFHSSQFGSFKADNPGMELIGKHHKQPFIAYVLAVAACDLHTARLDTICCSPSACFLYLVAAICPMQLVTAPGQQSCLLCFLQRSTA